MLRVLAASAMFTAAFAAAGSAGERHRQHDLTASSHHRQVQATLGTHCTPTADGTFCADDAYPLETEGRLPVHGRGRITLEFRVVPEEIDPSLRDRRSRSVHELIARGNGLTRTIRLPRTLPKGTDRLGVFVAYERGDADFEVDLRRHRHD
jgi:hypothetical protein